MKQCLVDVNAWLALLVVQHEHHNLVREWFGGLAATEAGMCRLVQLALIRLLANRSLMGNHALSASAGWDLLEKLMEDERVNFVPEPTGLDLVMPTLLRYPIPTGKLVTDAYLAAFAISASRRLVTLDGGFRQFHELDLELLAR